MVSPTIKSSDFPNSNTKQCSTPMSSPSSSSISSTSTNSKQRTITDDSNNNDETITKIKLEDGTDEVKIFSASTIQKNEPDDDVDIDGIEDRLSPVVEEPTSPNKNDSLNNNISGLYGSPFLHPYFHPMFHSYFMAAAAHANASGSSTDKSSTDGQANNPYGAPPPSLSPFPGMPFPPLYHPGMMNQPFQSNMFNPFGIPIPTPGVRPTTSFNRQQHQSASVYNGPPRDLNALLDARRPKKPHIKKPLNAFMLYMKEQRAHVIEECTLKESSAINKVLGQKWKELTRSQQDRYYELAKEERNRHMQMYPSWSARDNYGIKKKRQTVIVTNNSHKKMPREYNSPHKSVTKNPVQLENDCLNPKKCRARFGLEGQNQWCKHCRRKKKCTRFLEDDMPKHPSAHGNLSSLSSPTTTQSDDEDSMDELDSDDILSRQIDSIEDEQDDSDEENKQHKPIDSHQQQQFYLPSSAHLYQPSVLPSHFASGFLY